MLIITRNFYCHKSILNYIGIALLVYIILLRSLLINIIKHVIGAIEKACRIKKNHKNTFKQLHHN